MLDFLTQNWGSIIVGAAVAGIIVLITIKMLKDKKKGKTSCGCGCANCPSAGMCHKK